MYDDPCAHACQRESEMMNWNFLFFRGLSALYSLYLLLCDIKVVGHFYLFSIILNWSEFVKYMLCKYWEPVLILHFVFFHLYTYMDNGLTLSNKKVKKFSSFLFKAETFLHVHVLSSFDKCSPPPPSWRSRSYLKFIFLLLPYTIYYHQCCYFWYQTTVNILDLVIQLPAKRQWNILTQTHRACRKLLSVVQWEISSNHWCMHDWSITHRLQSIHILLVKEKFLLKQNDLQGYTPHPVIWTLIIFPLKCCNYSCATKKVLFCITKFYCLPAFLTAKG